MVAVLPLLAAASALLSVTGCVQSSLGAGLLARFRRTERRPVVLGNPPPVTVLKPLYGSEPLLEEALESFCTQDYPQMQILFGVRDADDPAIAIVRRLQERHPHLDMELVVDPALHGLNRKISNLMNILPRARHEILVISDSDIHVRPDYLQHIVSALHQPNTGWSPRCTRACPPVDRWCRCSRPARSTTTFCPASCSPAILGGRTVWAPPWRCAARRWMR